MIDKNIIERKLSLINKYISEIREQKQVKSYREFQKNLLFRRFLERNLHIAIEKMLDVCRQLVSGLNLKEPETYGECMDTLEVNNIIPSGKAETFRSMIAYRNYIVHAYEGVDDTVTYQIYKEQLGDFDEFIFLIRNYIRKI